jgi:hypothetical protein
MLRIKNMKTCQTVTGIVNKMIGKISDSRNASIGPNAYAAHGEGFTDR